MPDFYRRMRNRLRTPAEGADTLVWLCLSNRALKYPSSSFFQDRKPVSKHLPLAWTSSSQADELKFMNKLEALAETFRRK